MSRTVHDPIHSAPEPAASADPRETVSGPSAAETPEVPRRRRLGKRAVILVVAAVATVVLATTGWLVYTSVKHANDLAAAQQAYAASLEGLNAAQQGADEAAAALAAASRALTGHLAVAEDLATRLGDGTEALRAVASAMTTARTALAVADPKVPARSAPTLPENPDLLDYDAGRAAVEALIVEVDADAAVLAERARARERQDAALVAAWQARSAAAPGMAETAVAAAPNAPQETKDAVTKAAAAVLALADPLDARAPALWQALADASAGAAGAQAAWQAEQDRIAAEEAARQSQGYSGDDDGDDYGGGGGGGGYGYGLADLEAAYAAELGIPTSAVNCYQISNGIHCDYAYGDRSGWREVTI